jgi:hypothetical protein
VGVYKWRAPNIRDDLDPRLEIARFLRKVALLICRNLSPGGCDGVVADGFAVQAGGDGRIAGRAWRVGAFGEYLLAMSIRELIDHELPRSGSAAGYEPSSPVLPLALMLAGADGRWRICVICETTKVCAVFFNSMTCRAATPRAIGCGA